MAGKGKSISIFRATDSLLYFPIYLAIDSLARAEQLSYKKNNRVTPLRVWSSEALSLTLHPPSNDDAKCLSALTGCTDDAAIAITDALQLLDLDGDQPFRVAGVLVDRATVWLVYKTDGPDFLKLRNFLKLRQWGRVGDFPWAEPFPKGLRLGGVATGLTNRHLAGALLRKPVFDVSAKAFGLDEYYVLNDNECIAVLTSSPWLHNYYVRQLDRALAKHVKMMRIAPLFPLPFSAIVSTHDLLAADNGTGPISRLVKHLLVAVYFTYRYPHLAENRLVDIGAQFGWYGLHDIGDPDTMAAREAARRVIRDAIAWAVNNDLYSANLTGSWLAWDAAFELTARSRGGDRMDLGLVNKWYDVYVRPWSSSFLDQKVFAQQSWDQTALCQYWREEFRGILHSLLLEGGGGLVGSNAMRYERMAAK